MSELQRISITIEPELLLGLDRLVEQEGGNRSEVLRTLIRDRLVAGDHLETDIPCVATLSLLVRGTAPDLRSVQNGGGVGVISTSKVDLEGSASLYVATLTGHRAEVYTLAERARALPGVASTRLSLMS